MNIRLFGRIKDITETDIASYSILCMFPFDNNNDIIKDWN